MQWNFDKQIIKAIKGRPHSETSLFAAALTYVLLVIIDKGFVKTIIDLPALLGDGGGGRILLAIVGITALLGLLGAIFFALSDKSPGAGLAALLLFFLLMTNLAVSFEAFRYMMRGNVSWQIIFPFLTMAWAELKIMFFFFPRPGDTDTSPIKKRTSYEAITVGVVTIALVLLSTVVFKQHWALTFSIVLAYAEIINQKFTKLIFLRNES